MRTHKTNHRQFSRLFRTGAIGLLVAAVAALIVPAAVQAAPKKPTKGTIATTFTEATIASDLQASYFSIRLVEAASRASVNGKTVIVETRDGLVDVGGFWCTAETTTDYAPRDELSPSYGDDGAHPGRAICRIPSPRAAVQLRTGDLVVRFDGDATHGPTTAYVCGALTQREPCGP